MQDRGNIRPILRRGLPPLITVLILYLLYRSVDDPRRLLDVLASADPKYILLAVALVMINNLLASAWEHQTLAKALDLPLGLAESSFLKLVNYSLRALFLKASDLSRAVYYQRRFGMDLGLATAATVMIPLVNLYVLLLACLIGISISGSDPYGIKPWLWAAVLLGPPVVFIGLKSLRSASLGHGKLAALAANLSRFGELPRGTMPLVFGQGFLCLMLEVSILGLFLKSVGLTVPLSMLLWVVPSIQVIANLPVTLLGIGAREWVIVTLLAALGSPEELLAAGLLSSSLDRLLLALIGLPALGPFIRRLKGNKHAS